MFGSMKAKLFGAVLSILSPGLLAGTAQAQTVIDARPWARDRQELLRDRAQTRDDQLDLWRLEQLLAKFDRALATGNAAQLNACDTELRWLVNTELREGRGEIAEQRYEVRTDGAWGDWRGRRDDLREIGTKVALQRQRRRISRDLEALIGRFDPAALDARRALACEMIDLARSELEQDRAAWREDGSDLYGYGRQLRPVPRRGW